MIFPVLEAEGVLQVLDKTRLSAVKSFVSKDNDPITLVEIEPEAGDGFIDVTGTSYKDWYLDWSYSGPSRLIVVSVRITAGSVTTTSKTIQIYTALDDYLFSNDLDIMGLEPDILKYVPQGKNSYLSVHREAQKKILDWLDEAGYKDTSGNRLTKDAMILLDEVRSWSRYLVLSLIFRSIYNAVDDVFVDKAKYYESLALKASSRAFLRLDLDGDGEISTGEAVQILSRDLVRE